MAPRFTPLPTDLDSAHALILAERTARLEAEATVAEARARAARALAVNTSAEALIAHMKLEIETLRRAHHGHRSEAHGPAARADGAAARGTGDRRHRGRVGCRESGDQD